METRNIGQVRGLQPKAAVGESSHARWVVGTRRIRLDRAPGSSVGGIVPTAACSGAIAAVLELAVYLAQREFLPSIRRDSLFINRHVLWMIPATEFLVVACLLLVLGRLFRRRRRAFEVAAGGLAVFGPLAAIQGLHWGAVLVLAAGLGMRAGAWLVPRSPRALRRLRVVAMVAAAGVSAFIGWEYDQVAGREARSWARTIAPGKNAPSLLWIVLDTVRADHLSLYGYHRETSANLDRWARRGVTFEHARSSAPWTLPSHTTMFTGLWPHEHDTRLNRPYTRPDPLAAEVLRERGFATAGFAANHECCNACFGFARGFDHYVDQDSNHHVSPATVLTSSSLGLPIAYLGRRLGFRSLKWPPPERKKAAAEILEQGSEWLSRQRGALPERPFFLFLNLMDAHGPYLPPADYSRVYWTDPLPKLRVDASPKLGVEAVKSLGESSEADRPAKLARLEAATRQVTDLYDDSIRSMDIELGRFLDDLERRGVLERTWVIITADHGEHLGERGMFGHGCSLYDELVHVPLVLIPPLDLAPDDPSAAARGRRISGPVSLRDLPATVSDVVLGDTTSPFPGASLSEFWIPGSPSSDRELPIAQLTRQPFDAPDAVDEAAARHDREALFGPDRVYLRRGKGGSRAEEFFDSADRAQSRDLSGEASERSRLAALRESLDRRLANPR